VWLVGELLTDPKHFYSTSSRAGSRCNSAPFVHRQGAWPRHVALPVRAHEMDIYKRYFDLIATGR
jgi:hypothetical protein